MLIASGTAFPEVCFSFFWLLLQGSRRDLLLLIAALALISLLALGWALIIRKPGRRHHRHHRQKARAHTPATGQDPPRRRWHRRRRQDHRPRNPTLAETGGLPPVRSGPPLDPGL